MNADEAKSARPSGATSSNAPPPDPLHNDKLSEQSFLEKEAETAKAAIVQTLRQLQEDVKTAADLQVWARQHPWATVGVASLAGFVAAKAVIPSKNGHRTDEHREPPRSHSEPREERSQSSGGLGWLMIPLFDLLKTTVEKYVTAAVQRGSEAAADEQATMQEQTQTVGNGSPSY